MDTKPFWQSKTLITLAVKAVVGVSALIGVHLDPADATLISVVSAGVGLLGDGLVALFHTISTRRPA